MLEQSDGYFDSHLKGQKYNMFQKQKHRLRNAFFPSNLISVKFDVLGNRNHIQYQPVRKHEKKLNKQTKIKK